MDILAILSSMTDANKGNFNIFFLIFFGYLFFFLPFSFNCSQRVSWPLRRSGQGHHGCERGQPRTSGITQCQLRSVPRSSPFLCFARRHDGSSARSSLDEGGDQKHCIPSARLAVKWNSAWPFEIRNRLAAAEFMRYGCVAIAFATELGLDALAVDISATIRRIETLSIVQHLAAYRLHGWPVTFRISDRCLCR